MKPLIMFALVYMFVMQNITRLMWFYFTFIAKP